ncbi:hypothetical protein QNI19_16425 [Cytophagaceae bacterium DM2B3-1]|uniref:Uncharacterized protein n=1 Tax=Xanthocytophaga flava TaxID=3048013 RepID=A0ABT7CLG0_9BACT|nr:hypothetical protein [Xanthocytophaga flavus]MDJ1494532.1 hypothetical protein [Xanthocytophaga flavus]
MKKTSIIFLSVLAVAALAVVLYMKFFKVDFAIIQVDKVLFNVTFRFMGKTYTVNRSEQNSAIAQGSFTLNISKTSLTSSTLHFEIKRNGKIVRTENAYFI